MQNNRRILLAIGFSVALTAIEIAINLVFEIDISDITVFYFISIFLLNFSGYFYIFLLIYAGYALEKDKKEFQRTKFLKVSGFILLSIKIFLLAFYTILHLIGIDPSNPPFELTSRIINYAVYPVIFVTFFNFGVNNPKNYGNYATSFGILYLIYFIITLLYDFLIAPELTPGDTGAVIVGTTMTSMQLMLIFISSGYVLFLGIRIKLTHFILFGIFWGFHIVYRQIIDIIDAIGGYLGEYVYMLLIIFISLIGILVSIRFFELGKRLRRGVRIFISHAVEDYKPYRIDEMVKYLLNQRKIGHVYHCEADLTGNIDKWMKKTIKRCDLFIFISTQSSLASEDCITEINLARTNELHIIPVLGVGLGWEDLKELDLYREFGSTFNPMEFEKMCTDLYDNILKYKKERKTEIIEEKT